MNLLAEYDGVTRLHLEKIRQPKNSKVQDAYKRSSSELKTASVDHQTSDGDSSDDHESDDDDISVNSEADEPVVDTEDDANTAAETLVDNSEKKRGEVAVSVSPFYQTPRSTN
jgi:hypothetical protein